MLDTKLSVLVKLIVSAQLLFLITWSLNLSMPIVFLFPLTCVNCMAVFSVFVILMGEMRNKAVQQMISCDS